MSKNDDKPAVPGMFNDPAGSFGEPEESGLAAKSHGEEGAVSESRPTQTVETRLAVLETNVDHIKADVEELKTEVKHLRAEVNTGVRDLHTKVDTSVGELRTEMDANMKELRAEMDTNMKELRMEVGADMKELRAEVGADMRELRGEMKRLGAKIDSLQPYSLRNFIVVGTALTILIGLIKAVETLF